MIEVRMVRELSDKPPEVGLPPGYSLRWYREGDRETWHKIQDSTGIYGPLAPDLFEREFGDRPELLPEQQCFVEDAEGAPIGTATAWVATPDRPSNQGRLHWVAVSPAHQRKGIGAFLTEIACSRLRTRGATSVYLTTGSENAAAIQLYLSLGFRPEAEAEEERLAWHSLVAVVERRFASRLEDVLADGIMAWDREESVSSS